MNNSVVIKGNKHGIVVVLDADMEFSELKEHIATKFKDSAKFLGNAKMAISFEGKKLSDAQQREVLDIIAENSDLHVICIVDTTQNKMLNLRNV